MNRRIVPEILNFPQICCKPPYSILDENCRSIRRKFLFIILQSDRDNESEEKSLPNLYFYEDVYVSGLELEAY